MLVYKITNKTNNKIYVGKTTKTLEQRRAKHIQNIKARRHLPLYRAMLRDGIDSFLFEVIEICDSLEELNKREIFYINQYQSTSRSVGYNISTGGDGGKLPNYLYMIIGKKVSISNKGRIVSAETRALISAGQQGMVWSEERRKRHSERMIECGIKPPIHVVYGEDHPMYGKKHTEEAKRRISLSRKGKKYEDLYEEHIVKRLKDDRKNRWIAEGNPNYRNINKETLSDLLLSGKQTKEIAKQFNVSKQTIIAKTKLYFGVTPNEYRKLTKT